MITFIDVGYLINCKHDKGQEARLAVTSCVLNVIKHKIEKASHLFLQKFKEIKTIIRSYYLNIPSKRRLGSPKEIARKIAQFLEHKGYADIAFLFKLIARYDITDLEERIEDTLLRLRSKAEPINFITFLHHYFKEQNNYKIFPNKALDSIRKYLQQKKIEIIEIDDRKLWIELESETDREDRYQLLCIEKYKQNSGAPETYLLTTDHKLPNTAQPFRNIKVKVVDCQA